MTVSARTATLSLKQFRQSLTEWVARCTARLLPRKAAYDAIVLEARAMSSFASGISRLARGRAISDLYAAQLLRDMLGEATVSGGVAVRTRIRNEAALDRLIADHGGRFVLYTAHFFLSMAIPEVIARKGLNAIMIAGYDGDMQRLNWFGRSEPPALIASDAACLVRARKALAAERPVMLCPDIAVAVPGAAQRYEVVVNPNTFRFAERAGAAAIFAATSLGADGAIEIEFVRPDEETGDARALGAAYCAFLQPRIGRPCRMLDRHDPLIAETERSAVA